MKTSQTVVNRKKNQKDDSFDQFTALPLDLQKLIISFLPTEDILHYAMSCKAAAAQMDDIFRLVRADKNRVCEILKKLDKYFATIMNLEKQLDQSDQINAIIKLWIAHDKSNFYSLKKLPNLFFKYDVINPDAKIDDTIRAIDKIRSKLPTEPTLSNTAINKILSSTAKVLTYGAIFEVVFSSLLADIFIQPGIWPQNSAFNLFFILLVTSGVMAFVNFNLINHQVNIINKHLQSSFNEQVNENLTQAEQQQLSFAKAFSYRNAFFKEYKKLNSEQLSEQPEFVELPPRTLDYLKSLAQEPTAVRLTL